MMYWAVKDDGNYEVIDGQQRTISICQFINKEFSVVYGNIAQNRKFNSLQDDEQEQILDY